MVTDKLIKVVTRTTFLRDKVHDRKQRSPPSSQFVEKWWPQRCWSYTTWTLRPKYRTTPAPRWKSWLSTTACSQTTGKHIGVFTCGKLRMRSNNK